MSWRLSSDSPPWKLSSPSLPSSAIAASATSQLGDGCGAVRLHADAERGGRLLGIRQLRFVAAPAGRGRQQRDARHLGRRGLQQGQTLGRHARRQLVHAGHEAARPLEALRETVADHAGTRRDHHRHGRIRLAHRQRDRQCTSDDQLEIHLRELVDMMLQLPWGAGQQPHLDLDVLPFDVAEAAELTFERRGQRRDVAVDETDAEGGTAVARARRRIRAETPSRASARLRRNDRRSQALPME